MFSVVKGVRVKAVLNSMREERTRDGERQVGMEGGGGGGSKKGRRKEQIEIDYDRERERVLDYQGMKIKVHRSGFPVNNINSNNIV